MARSEDHSEGALAFAAATTLRESNPAWSVVPLFYSALHLIRADLATRSGVPDNLRHPERHFSQWAGGAPKRWGTNDVVAKVYPIRISRPYKSLHHASVGVRYEMAAPASGEMHRLWGHYESLTDEHGKLG